MGKARSPWCCCVLGPGEACLQNAPSGKMSPEAFLMNATFTLAAGTSPHQTRDLITECLLGMPCGSGGITLSKALLACGGSNSAVLLELKSLPQPMKQAQMKTTTTILGRWSQSRGPMDSSRATKEAGSSFPPPSRARIPCTTGPPLNLPLHLKTIPLWTRLLGLSRQTFMIHVL